MPKFVQLLFPERIWTIPNDKDCVYLTFDDGPNPEVTPWVLEELKKHCAKATFFCIGKNVGKRPEIFQQILSEGHSVGNHTFDHLNGWKTKTSEYIENVEKAESRMVNNSEFEILNSELFRPPYGRLASKQAKLLKKKGYKIIMWSIISFDYDAKLSKEKCLQNVLKNLKPGSIVVFHDSLKAEKNLRYALPKTLEFIAKKGWKCSSIQNSEF
ncbi:polysaccharide deacetylase family protein [Aequorivita sp. H23M31]|uniref:Polysaccharide deacetylase family protein n=1 Tax=Aequorivita ciconiae TaxID=2494375 RepID=A0A410G7I1_9FLAO|nr:polysaccharide deacetylase family protein [Aequorivita sp. H23M31]